MEKSQNERVKEIFQEAIQRPAEERPAYVESAANDDDQVRDRVMALLLAHAKNDDFLTSRLDGSPDPVGSEDRGYVGTKIGPYKLLQEIGEGGFGVVYMAEQEEPIRRRVALKVIKPGMDTKQVIARFEAERQALAMMDHPNIAKVFEAGTTEAGRPYFVMELVKGIPITDYCDEHQLNTRERLALFADVCGAVDHAHQSGIIHRDLKPSNVMVTLHDGRPVPKVIDFGVAKATHVKLTESTLFTEYNQFIGTPTYMSPEQAAYEGLEVDKRSDVYSLGVLLYELLTGTTPHDARAMKQAAYVEVLRIIKEEEPPKPSTRIQTMGEGREEHAKHRAADPVGLAKLLRGDLDWIVMKALDKERGRRYGSASDLAADIGRYFEQRPIVARPPSTVYRARKLFRRRRGPFAAAAVVALLTLIDVAYVGWQRSQMAEGASVADATGISTTLTTREVWVPGDDEGNIGFGEVSPDGRYLSYMDWDASNLGVRDLVTGENRLVTSEESLSDGIPGCNYSGEGSVWSPDGQQLAYMRYVCDVGYELRLTGLEGNDSRLLSRYAWPLGWSPDGRHLAVETWVPGEDASAIGLMDVNDGSVRRVKTFDQGLSGPMGFSPDGKHIVYGQSPDGSTAQDLYLLSVDDGREVRLTETESHEEFLAWAPDGSLLLTEYESGEYALWSMGLPDGNAPTSPVLLRANLGDVGGHGFTRDGAFFYTVWPANPANAHVASFDPEAGQALGAVEPVSPIRFTEFSTWSPDGEFVAYLTPLPRGYDLVVRSEATGAEKAVRLDLTRRYKMQWLPSGLFLGGRFEEMDGFYRVDPDDLESPEWIHSDRNGMLSPDGRTLYSDRKQGRVLKTDLLTGDVTVLYREVEGDRNSISWLSPDGLELAIRTGPDGAQTLKVFPTKGGEPRHLADLTYQGEPLTLHGRGAWTPDGEHVVFFATNPASGAHRLYRVPNEGGEIVPAGLEGGPDGFDATTSVPRFSPDGRQIAFNAFRGETGALWVLENFLPEPDGNSR